ncbi:Na+/melibiose symporter [Streptomyces sp. yr375]|uniref:MFS transporter n=1 Tax=Streptomyces sp. yr375 TaxID=1761906 RepID=UPI0008C93988|nr:MFS transporter [Streptomyces sp. yr375]SEQ01328.1 Na+/melibiose symporter [Streptomyces sp. yr375]
MTTPSLTDMSGGDPPPAEAASTAQVLDPTEPGTSPKYLRGRALRRYALWYGLALAAFSSIWGGVGSLLLPNQVQTLEAARFFTGGDAGVDLQKLTALKNAIAAGTATATPEQSRLLGILADFDASRAQSLALVASIGLIATMVAQPLIGVFSDRTRTRFGRRAPWVLLGSFVGAGFLVGVRFAPTVAVLTVLWVIASVALNAAASPLGATLADRIPETRRGSMSAFGGFGSFLGGVLGSVGAGAALSTLGLDSYFVFAALVVLCVALFVWRVKDGSSLDLRVPKFEWKSFLLGFTYAVRDRDYRWVWVARILLTFGYGVSGALGLYMLQSYVKPALSLAEATKLVPLFALTALPATLVAIVIAGPLSDRLQRRKSFVFAASVLMAASMAIPLLSPTVPALFVQAVVAGFAFGIYIPVDQALVVDVLPDPNAYGRDLGVANLATNLGQSLGPALAGAVVTITGGYTFVWVAAFALVALAAICILPVRRR